MRKTIRHLAYAALFCIVLPAALYCWSVTAQLAHMPSPPPQQVGWCLAIIGMLVFVWAALVFIVKTGKLPLNADPPDRAIMAGPYAIVADPLYVGFNAAVFGIAAILQNRFGFFIVAPVLAAATIALVVGYENVRRPRRPHPALLDVPESAGRPATAGEAVATVVNVLVLVFIALPFTGANALAIPTLLLAPGSAAVLTIGLSAGALRRGLGIFATTLMIVTIVFGFSDPTLAVTAPVGIAVAAFGLFNRRLMRLMAVVLLMTADMGAVFLGDGWRGAAVIGGAFILAALLPVLHRAMVRFSEWVANSWSALEIGPVRIINYAIYPFIAALIGASVFEALAPGPAFAEVIIIGCIGLFGAGLWANLIENTGKLARPFGYFGFMIGGAIGTVAAAVFFGVPVLSIAGAAALAAPPVQAIGRLRCLVQGCCHGRPSTDGLTAIVYRRTESRVLKIAGLGGVPVHPTPLYSIYGNLIVAIVLVRLAWGGFPAGLIAGLYLIGSGVARFIEEAFRGEPQTRVLFGLKMYQWLALTELLGGALMTIFPSEPLMLRPLGAAEIGVALAIAGLAGLAMGVDFPNSRLRFSRLTPK